MAKKQKSFDVYARISVDACVTIRAANLEEAFALANSMVVSDFIAFHGEHVGGEPIRVSGITESV